ncbi:hypothetical protein ACP4OV_013640 [Aristida adscensionis]
MHLLICRICHNHEHCCSNTVACRSSIAVRAGSEDARRHQRGRRGVRAAGTHAQHHRRHRRRRHEPARRRLRRRAQVPPRRPRRAAAKLPGLGYSLADSFRLSAVTDTAAAGFVKVDSACCGGCRLRAEADCLPGGELCGDRDRYVFWDRVHPSKRAAQLLAEAYYDGPAQITAPISFKQLAQKT